MVLAVGVSVGCTHTRAGSNLPAPSVVPSLTLRPGDVVGVRIWPDSTLSGDYPIEESGKVYLPMLGPVPAAGLQPDSLRGELRRLYSVAMRTPVVSITPRFRIGVLGAVQRPGLYQITPAQTLYDVIAMAGGFRPDAREDEMRVVRENQVIDVNARRALESGEALYGLELRSGDQIVVPTRTAFPIQFVTLTLQALVFAMTLLTYLRR